MARILSSAQEESIYFLGLDYSINPSNFEVSFLNP